MKSINPFRQAWPPGGSYLTLNKTLEKMTYYALQRKTVNTYVRHELLKNMTNLPERWVEIAISKDAEQLKKHAVPGDRIINRDTLEVQEAL